MEELIAFYIYCSLNLVIINICLLLLDYEDYCSDTHEMPYILIKILAGSIGGCTIINTILILVGCLKGKSMARYICMVAPLEYFVIYGWIIACTVSTCGGYGDNCGTSALCIMILLLVYQVLFTSWSKHSMYWMYAVEIEKEDELVIEIEINDGRSVMV